MKFIFDTLKFDKLKLLSHASACKKKFNDQNIFLRSNNQILCNFLYQLTFFFYNVYFFTFNNI